MGREELKRQIDDLMQQYADKSPCIIVLHQ